MKGNWKGFVLVFCLLSVLLPTTMGVSAQEPPDRTRQQLESRAAETGQEDEEDDSHLLQWDHLRRHPVNLNKASEEELSYLRILTPLQIRSLLQYRSLLGGLTSLSELQAVPGWDTGTIVRILPFVTIKVPLLDKATAADVIKKGEGTVMLTVSRKWPVSSDSSSSARYLGDPYRVYVRYRYHYRNLLHYGIVGEKDAGEPFLAHGGRGFDHYSFHLFLRTEGVLKALVAGDYTVQLGQGLLQWQALGFGKSNEVLDIKRQAPVLLPYRSSGEFHFNRGAGITLQRGNWEGSLFLSSIRRSANAVADTFSGFVTTGLHRTESERADRRSVGHQSFGGAIRFRNSLLSIGLNGVAHRFSHHLSPAPEPYRINAGRGSGFWTGSLDYAATWHNLHLFGEVATDHQGHLSQVHGALLSMERRVSLALHLRILPSAFHNLFGNAFTESSPPVNENGIYLGVAIRATSQWQLRLYGDFFRFPWLRYRIDAPSAGAGYLVEIGYVPDKVTQFSVLYRRSQGPVSLKGNHTHALAPMTRQSLRLHLSLLASPSWELRVRSEANWLRSGAAGEGGWLSYVEGIYRNRKLTWSGRGLYFDADSYNSRLYAFETDVQYSLTIPAFYHTGFRYYLQAKYVLSDRCAFWLRWAHTIPVRNAYRTPAPDGATHELKTQMIFQLFKQR